MLAKVTSASCIGIEAYPIEIEVDLTAGLPQVTIVGLPDQAVKESRDRIKSAIKNCGFKFPARRKVVVNLAPADVKKEGPIMDLPIALGILLASHQISPEKINSFCIIGELALDGTLRNTKGALPVALELAGCGKHLLLPLQNANEAALQSDVAVFPVKDLKEAVLLLNGEKYVAPFTVDQSRYFTKDIVYPYDFNEVRGQRVVKRALEVAVSGGHNMLMVGPPGSGKTMLAKRLPSILPDLTHEEALDITRIHSVSKGSLCRPAQRPFRSPHHTISPIALAGGGPIPKPGEVSLAHNGVLFLDELPEFNRNVLEVLRSPLEDKVVTIARAKHVITFPSHFMLVCAMNPCPCGYFGDARKECRCASTKIEKYLSKISGPLLDRIDIHLEVRRVPYAAIKDERPAENSQIIRRRINAVRMLQQARFRNSRTAHLNADMGPHQIKQFCRLTSDAEKLLELAIKELFFSARAYHKVLKVARTIRDMKILSDSEGRYRDKGTVVFIEADDISEAVQYRTLDRNWF